MSVQILFIVSIRVIVALLHINSLVKCCMMQCSVQDILPPSRHPRPVQEMTDWNQTVLR